MSTTTRTRRSYGSTAATGRSARALHQVAGTALLAQAIRRSESLASELRNGKRKGPLGRTIEMIWDIERIPKLSAAPIVREVQLAQREAQIRHSPEVVAARFCRKLVEKEPLKEGLENQGTQLLQAGRIDLDTWRRTYFWPELHVAMSMDALAEHLIGRGIDWRSGLAWEDVL